MTCGLENDMRNMANFHQSTWKWQNWEFDGILLSKVENVWAKNLQRSYVSWQRRMMQNLKRNWFVIWKLTWGILQILTWTLENLKNLLFNWLLWPKYIMFELKKYRGVMFDGTEDWCKIWRKTDLCFQKWHEEFGKFSPEHLKVSKLGLSWHPFVQSWKCMSLKFTGELYVMTMKNDAKSEEELTCRFKIDMRNLTNFDRSTQKSQKKFAR